MNTLDNICSRENIAENNFKGAFNHHGRLGSTNRRDLAIHALFLIAMLPF